MITEDYVSFEIAKLLKEKGFNEGCRARYGTAGSFSYEKYEIESGGCEMHNAILTPTLQMAMKWLRKTYNICVISFPIVTDDDGEAGCLWKYVISRKLKTLYDSYGLYESNESALSNGLKYALENLI